MMQGKFTEKAKAAIEAAQRAAAAMGQNYVGTEHLLLGLSQVPDSVSARAIESQGVTAEMIEARIREVSQNIQQLQETDISAKYSYFRSSLFLSLLLSLHILTLRSFLFLRLRMIRICHIFFSVILHRHPTVSLCTP